MSETGSSDERGVGRRELVYAAGGMLLGVMAPLGWIILRLLLFWQDGAVL